jgi:hypothetical protein
VIGSGGDITATGTCASSSSSTFWGSGTAIKGRGTGSFDGNDDYVGTTDQSGLTSSYSASFWMRPGKTYQAPDSNVYWLINTPGDTTEYRGWVNITITNDTNASKIQFQFYDDSASYQIVRTVNDTWIQDTWYHIICVFDDTADTMTIYVNGALENQLTGVNTNPGEPDHEINIGGRRDAGGQFDGLIDEVKIWNYALTSEQVRTEYAGGAVRFGD